MGACPEKVRMGGGKVVKYEGYGRSVRRQFNIGLLIVYIYRFSCYISLPVNQSL